MEHEASIKSFTDLDTWKQGHILVLRVYELTKLFPKEEQFGLTNQLRRAVVSVTSNIAEGFSRLSYNDKAHFYTMAHGSLTEAQNQLIVARDVKYITTDRFDQIAQQSVVVHKLLTGLIKSTKQRKAAA
jgi:four helix bundle protein